MFYIFSDKNARGPSCPEVKDKARIARSDAAKARRTHARFVQEMVYRFDQGAVTLHRSISRKSVVSGANRVSFAVLFLIVGNFLLV